MPEASRSVVVDVPRDFFFGVISDYERYPEFIPQMKSVTVERVTPANGAAGPVRDVAFRLDLVKTLGYTLQMAEESPSRITWRLVRGDLMKENEGYWQLVAAGEGRTQATYTVSIAFKGFIPAAVTTRLVGVQLPEMLQQFKLRAETMYRDASRR
jgi:coenzyme Q-binding protein COQ10